uniref:Uncharacterized protein n=1 Tax=Setaria viridis TaxID=4556 RepID=A0A4U6TJ10_SETVI|nr:hypothetical protein SEVIR_8G142400v2 [Setaria viridis]
MQSGPGRAGGGSGRPKFRRLAGGLGTVRGREAYGLTLGWFEVVGGDGRLDQGGTQRRTACGGSGYRQRCSGDGGTLRGQPMGSRAAREGGELTGGVGVVWGGAEGGPPQRGEARRVLLRPLMAVAPLADRGGRVVRQVRVRQTSGGAGARGGRLCRGVRWARRVLEASRPGRRSDLDLMITRAKIYL